MDYSIDPLIDSLLFPREAAKLDVFRSSTGKSAHRNKIFRLMQTGCLSADRERVRLPSIKTPSGLATSREAIEWFIFRLTHGATIPAATATKPRHECDNAQADEALAAAGW